MSMVSSGPDRTPRNDRAGSARLRGARSTRKAGGTQDSGQGSVSKEESKNRLGEARRLMPPRGSMDETISRAITTPPRAARRALRNIQIPYGPANEFGGNIPSPRQSYEMPAPLPRSFDPGTDALLRSYMSRMEAPEEPRVRDMPNMSLEEMAPYNRPADDINDAFFGPDRKRFDVVEFLMGLMGRR